MSLSIMEGRNPPPPASHTIPDNPDMRKFWGTRRSSSYFKTVIGIIVAWGSYLALDAYLDRNKTHFLNQKLRVTPEEIKTRHRNILLSGQLRTTNLQLSSRVQKIDWTGNLRFDDGLDFAADVKAARTASAVDEDPLRVQSLERG